MPTRFRNSCFWGLTPIEWHAFWIGTAQATEDRAMFEPHLIPELEELLNLVEAKEASRHGPLNTSPPHWNDRGAAFVYLPEVT